MTARSFAPFEYVVDNLRDIRRNQARQAVEPQIRAFERRVMPVRLFVGNLPYDATEAELREHFSAAGPLSYLYLPTDRETGKPRGFAFIEFNDRGQAEEAIRRFNNQLYKGRPISVSEARAKEDRPRPSSPPRAAPQRTEPPPGLGAGLPPVRGEQAPRSFGPDAPPRRNRTKTKRTPKSERAPKGPMREVVRGQFFGGDDDDAYDDDLSEENFASRVEDDYDDDKDNY
ncbi:MAG TPA: RNA-binding protein [Blastocatellia bacterium]|jgi:RNA recognition motif-containing protein